MPFQTDKYHTPDVHQVFNQFRSEHDVVNFTSTEFTPTEDLNNAALELVKAGFLEHYLDDVQSRLYCLSPVGHHIYRVWEQTRDLALEEAARMFDEEADKIRHHKNGMQLIFEGISERIRSLMWSSKATTQTIHKRVNFL